MCANFIFLLPQRWFAPLNRGLVVEMNRKKVRECIKNEFYLRRCIISYSRLLSLMCHFSRSLLAFDLSSFSGSDENLTLNLSSLFYWIRSAWKLSKRNSIWIFFIFTLSYSVYRRLGCFKLWTRSKHLTLLGIGIFESRPFVVLIYILNVCLINRFKLAEVKQELLSTL